MKEDTNKNDILENLKQRYLYICKEESIIDDEIKRIRKEILSKKAEETLAEAKSILYSEYKKERE